jgi:signal peptidase II
MAEAVSAVTPAAAVPAATMRGKHLAFWTALVIVTLDLWSKHAVFDALALHEELWLAGDWFGFKPVLNPGIMWGGLSEWSHLLPWMRVVAAIAVVLMLRSTPRAARHTLFALGLVLGGALGNIYDGFDQGMVRDFLIVDLDVRFFDPFPVFNVADSAICSGVVLLALGMVFERPPSPEPDAGPAARAAGDGDGAAGRESE